MGLLLAVWTSSVVAVTNSVAPTDLAPLRVEVGTVVPEGYLTLSPKTERYFGVTDSSNLVRRIEHLFDGIGGMAVTALEEVTVGVHGQFDG